MKELGKSNPKELSIEATAYSQSISIETIGAIINRQTYDATSNTYEPDFSQRPCQLFPKCFLIDPDNPVQTEVFNKQFESFKWFEVTSEGETLIYPSAEAGGIKAGYDVEKEGEYKGMLYVKSNGKIGSQRTVKFVASWKDPLSGYVYRFQASKPIAVDDITEARPVLALDAPAAIRWNPMRMPAGQTINAKVFVGNNDMTDSNKVKLWWLRVLGDGTKELITTADETTSWEIDAITTSKSGQITGISINREMIGDSISYEVHAVYNAEGVFPKSYSNTDAIGTTTIARFIPSLDVNYSGSTTSIANGVLSVLCTAYVSDGAGTLDASVWNQYARARWAFVNYSIDRDGNRTESERFIGYGTEMLIPVEQAQFLRVAIEDRGSNVAIVDEDGNYLTDDDGKRLIERELVN